MSTSTGHRGSTDPSRPGDGTPPDDPSASRGLVVGGEDLDPRTLLVLHSLLRVLDGHDGQRLRVGERREDCDLLFVPAAWPHRTDPRCVVVRVCEEAGEAARLDGAGLRIVAPLRLSNVAPVLHACREAHRAGEARDEAARGCAGLYLALTRHVMARDRRTQVFALRPEGALVVDFGRERVHAAAGLDAWLSGRLRLAGEPPHRADDAERQAARALPAVRLRDLVWRLSRQLGEAEVAGGAPDGRYQLMRWPDAVVLAEPGMPRLAALLTHRPMALDAVAAASGLSVPRVRWFLQTCLAFGVALCVDDEGRALSRVSEGSAPPSPSQGVPLSPRGTRLPGPSTGGVPTSLLGRLRQHLGLW